MSAEQPDKGEEWHPEQGGESAGPASPLLETDGRAGGREGGKAAAGIWNVWVWVFVCVCVWLSVCGYVCVCLCGWVCLCVCACGTCG